MMRKMICALILAMMMPLAVSARGVEGFGSIRIRLNVGDLAVTNGAFALRQVGTKTTDGYRILDDYGGGFVLERDALSPHLAQWMAEGVGMFDKHMLLDVDGNACFSKLPEGLYLVKQTELTDGFYPLQPFLMSIPCENRWDVIINAEPLPRVAEAPSTAQPLEPMIGMIGMIFSGIGLLLCGKYRKKI